MKPRFSPSSSYGWAIFLPVILSLFFSVGCSKKEEDEKAPLTLSNPIASPDPVQQGKAVLFTAGASSPDGAVASVSIDLTPLGVTPAVQDMHDDGLSGDAAAGDGTWSYSHTLDPGTTAGIYSLSVSASDSLGQTAATAIAFTVETNNPPTASNGSISKDPTPRGTYVVVSVDAADADGAVQSVTADLTDLGGSANAPLYDNGSNGDATAGDGTYSFRVFVVTTASPGTGKTVAFTVTDDGQKTATDSVTFEILTNIAPQLSSPSVTPTIQVQRLDVVFNVTATDDTGVTSVTINLVPIGGPGAEPLYDDGDLSNHGDATAGDNIYSCIHTISAIAPGGIHSLIFTATDTQSETNTVSVSLTVDPNQPPVLGSALANPDPTPRNQNVLFTVNASDADGFIISLTADLTALGGTSTEAFYNDGTHGDLAAGDGVFSLLFYITPTATVATHLLPVTATDDDTVTTTTNISLTVQTNLAPTVSSPTAAPDPQEQGLTVTLSVSAVDDVAVASVTADLTSLTGPSNHPLYDDGDTINHGDATAGDNVYSNLYLIPATTIPASYSLSFTAVDGASASNSAGISLTVSANTPPVVSNETLTPPLVVPGQTVILEADVVDPHTLSSVTVDLTGLGLSATAAMVDDGTGPDVTPNDNTYTCQFTPGALTPGGAKTLVITATDALSATGTGSASLSVARFKLEHAGFLEDIHGTSSSNIYTVGESSQVYRFDGTTWRVIDARPGTDVNWWGVWCESANSVWVGGDSARVSHFDGTAWSTRDIGSASSYEARAFWDDGAGKVYVVGGLPGAREGTGRNDHDSDDGYMWAVWTNSTSSWNSPVTTTSGDDDLNGIFGVSATDMVAVGDDGLILHGNGSTWDNSKRLTTTDDLFGVWGFNDGTHTYYWAVAGRNSGTATPQIYRYSSGTGAWAAVTSLPTDPTTSTTPAVNLRGIYGSYTGSTLNAIYVTGNYSFSSPVWYGTVWKSTDGLNFTQVTAAAYPSSNSYFPHAPYRLILSDVWMASGASDVWITGRRSIQHYNSSASPPWKEYSRGTYENTRALDVFSTTRAITWDHTNRPTSRAQLPSIVHEFNSGTWNEYTATSGNIGPALLTYPMLDPPTTPHPNITPRMYAVRFFSNSDCYGVGDDGHVFYWDGTNAVNHDFSSVAQYGTSSTDQRRLYALWGSSATNFWFGGEGNRVYKYAGLGWTTPPSATVLSGASGDITSIWEASSTDVYAVKADTCLGTRTANSGNIYHYGGSSWASIAGANNMPSTGSLANLNSVWGKSGGEVYVVGDGGFAMVWNGSTWSSLASALGNPTTDLHAVFGSGTATGDDVFIAGEGMRMWVKMGTTWYALRANASTASFLGGDSVGSFILATGTKGITMSLEK